jgi:diaminopimelate epimerase
VERLTQTAIVRMCDRNWGIGSDGILLLVPTSRADFGLRIFNPDGSEAEKSGNGLRIFAKYLWDHGRVKKDRFTVDTRGGVVECKCHVRAGRMNLVTVEMGQATFRAPEIPMNGPDREVVGVPLQLPDGTMLSVTAVSVGNPHCVIFVDDVDRIPVREIGPEIETDPFFPKRVNVEFVQVVDPSTLKVRVWERGSGETLACGTGACATLVAANLTGKTEKQASIHLPGGTLNIHWDGSNRIQMVGPATEVFRGIINV